MVRLEKSIYELLLNTPTLSRARKIASPRKWFTETRWRFMTVAAHKFCAEGLTSKFYRAIEPFFAKFFYRYVRDIATSRGLAFEDFFLFQDREMRRCVVHENILRTGSHPYQHIMFAHRRARFYKVERAVRGFNVPDYLQKEAKSRLVSETVKNMQTWGDYVTQHFYSDMTPTTHSTPIARWHPLEIFLAYGSMSQQGWERYFYNEVVYDEYTVEDEKESQYPFGKLNLTNADDRAHFESEVNRFIKLYPGSIVQEGEKFDFKAFYAGWALNHKKEVPGIKSDDSLIEDAKKKLESWTERLEAPGKKHKSAVKVGSIMPKFIRDQQGTKAILH